MRPFGVSPLIQIVQCARAKQTGGVDVPPNSLNVVTCKMDLGLNPTASSLHTGQKSCGRLLRLRSGGLNTVCRCDRCLFDIAIVPDEKTCL